jgi:hypothetical protein
MCPSTESTGAQHEFAANVLCNLLRHISIENDKGHEPFLVSHAWTDGPVMYLVYQAPPSDRTWGLVRDTRQSIIDPGPWPDLNEAVLYYYLLDFEENQPSSSFRRPDEADTIWWFGSPREGLPELLSDIPEKHLCVTHTESRPVNDNRDQSRATEPRLYGNPM